MWITRPVGMLMMDAVRRYPFDWTTFKGHRAAGYEKVFNQLRHSVTTMSQ
jgi:hypothetical protein